MSVSVNYNATLSLDTVGGTNIPSPTQTYNTTYSVGTYSAGPIAVPVTSTPTALPLVPGTAVYTLRIYNAGAAALIVDMQNTATNSSKITIAAGGDMTFNNVTLAMTGAGISNYGTWRLSCATTTTANVSLVYT